jgi:hypothetical protein
MSVILLSIIAACLLFGASAVLGFLEAGFWVLVAALIVGLAVWGLVAAAGAIANAVGDLLALFRLALFRPKGDPPYDEKAKEGVRPARDSTFDDFLAEQREQREQLGRDRCVEIIAPSKLSTAPDSDDLLKDDEAMAALAERLFSPRGPLNPASSRRSPEIPAGPSLMERIEELNRQLRAMNRERDKITGRPLSPEMDAGIRRLLRENPNHHDDILSELRRNNWCVGGLPSEPAGAC